MELKLGSIPLRVQGNFFIMTAVLGFNEGDPMRLAIWVVVVLVSVVIHELGHALMGKAFGLEPSIVLHGMGGLTSFNGGRAELSTGKSIAVSLAGPFAGFAFATLLFALRLNPANPLVHHALRNFFWVNVAWGVFNLVPMLPLDGGNVLRAAAKGITKDHGEKIARIVSIALAGGIVLLSIVTKQWWTIYLGLLFGYQNVQAMRQAGQTNADHALGSVIEQAHAALSRNQAAEATRLLQPALASASSASAEVRQIGLRVYVAALVEQHAWSDAMSVLERERLVIGADDLARWSQAMRQLGRDAEAERIDELVKAPAPLSEFRA